MPYLQEITANKDNPQELEALYQSASTKKEVRQFSSDLHACLTSDEDNLLLQAWYYRLMSGEKETKKREGAGVNWKLAIPLGILNGLVLWLLSDARLVFPNDAPYVAIMGAPVMALFVIWFLVLTAQKNYRRAIGVSIGLVVIVVAVFLLNNLVAQSVTDHYLILMLPHLALLAWAGIGLVLIWLVKDADNRFAFLMRSLEVFIVGGLYLIAGVIFGVITMGLFQALSIDLPEVVMRLIVAGGAGLIPVLAVATIYDPLAEPKNQDFTQGLSKFIGTMMRLLLPLTLFVLLVYIFVIPFNFMEPFKNRDVLIVYNAMLFAIMGLLVGATPLDLEEVSPRLGTWLRRGILAVVILATLVSLYALSALVYRTVNATITINRLTMLGWNVINIVLLVLMMVRLLMRREQPWNQRIKSVFSLGAVLYVAWTLIVVLIFPFIFG